MSASLSNLPLLLTILICTLAGIGIGGILGWHVRGWRGQKKRTERESLMSELQIELAAVTNTLNAKTRDLHTFQSISNSEITRLKAALDKKCNQLSEQSGSISEKDIAIENTDLPASALLQSIGSASTDASDTDQVQAGEERRQDVRRFAERKAAVLANQLLFQKTVDEAAQAESNNVKLTDTESDSAKLTKTETPKAGSSSESADEFFDLKNETVVGDTEKYFAHSHTQSAVADKQISPDQDHLVQKLIEKVQFAEAELIELRATNEQLAYTTQTLQAEVMSVDSSSDEQIQSMIVESKNNHSTIVSHEQKLKDLNKTIATQVSQLTVLRSNLRDAEEANIELKRVKSELLELQKEVDEAAIQSRDLEPLQEKIQILTRKLQITDRLNSELQAQVTDIPLLTQQMQSLEVNARKLKSTDAHLNELNQKWQFTERQNSNLRQINNKLSTQLSQLELNTSTQRNALEQQTAVTNELSGRLQKLTQEAKEKQFERSELTFLAEKLRRTEQNNIDLLKNQKHVESLELDLQHATAVNTEREGELEDLAGLRKKLNLSEQNNRDLSKQFAEFDVIARKLHIAELQLDDLAQKAQRVNDLQSQLDVLQQDNVRLQTLLKGMRENARESQACTSSVKKPTQGNIERSKPAANKKVAVDSVDKDDLKQIRGIGPKLERLLNENDIVSFQQIAELNKASIQHLAENLGAFGSRIRRDKWVSSAKNLIKLQQKMPSKKAA